MKESSVDVLCFYYILGLNDLDEREEETIVSE